MNDNMYYKRLNQSFSLGILGGLIGAIVGAIIWAIVVVMTRYDIAWMAIGIGFLVGKSVNIFGKGIDFHFRIIGALFSLIACLLGNLLTVIIITSNYEGIPFYELLQIIDFEVIINILKETFAPIDLFFYAIAIFVAFYISVDGEEDDESDDEIEKSDDLPKNKE